MDLANSPASLWEGKRIRLRAIEPSDWETYFRWNFDDEQTRALDVIPLPPSQASVRAWVERATLQEPQGDNKRFTIARLSDNLAVGDLTVNYCDPRVGALSYGVNIAQAERGKGYASEAILLALRYYFEERRYQKATIRVFSFNDASIRLHERLGFQREGQIRRTVYTHGRYFDELLYGMTVEEFRERHADMLSAREEV